eukprot:6001716-Pyramimonas_sp.AAC.1
MREVEDQWEESAAAPTPIVTRPEGAELPRPAARNAMQADGVSLRSAGREAGESSGRWCLGART